MCGDNSGSGGLVGTQDTHVAGTWTAGSTSSPSSGSSTPRCEREASEMQQTVATRRQLAMLSSTWECRRRREAGRTHRPVERRTNEHSSHDNPTLLYLFDRISSTNTCVVLLFPRIRVLSRRNEASPRCRNRSYFQSRPIEGNQSEGTLGSTQTTLTPPPTSPSSPSEPTLAQPRSQPLAPKVRWAPSSRLRGGQRVRVGWGWGQECWLRQARAADNRHGLLIRGSRHAPRRTGCPSSANQPAAS